jgi:hypothetical protein
MMSGTLQAEAVPVPSSDGEPPADWWIADDRIDHEARITSVDFGPRSLRSSKTGDCGKFTRPEMA